MPTASGALKMGLLPEQPDPTRSAWEQAFPGGPAWTETQVALVSVKDSGKEAGIVPARRRAASTCRGP